MQEAGRGRREARDRTFLPTPSPLFPELQERCWPYGLTGFCPHWHGDDAAEAPAHAPAAPAPVSAEQQRLAQADHASALLRPGCDTAGARCWASRSFT